MAKHAMAEKTDLPAATETLAPAALGDRFAEDSGKGVSTDQADNQTPLIYILQGLSPAAQKGNAARIEGAEAGDFWLRNASEPIISGEEGLIFQPCYFDKDFVEWGPTRGSGIFGRHRQMPAEAVKDTDPNNPGKIIDVMPNGNVIVETRYHVGYVLNSGMPIAYVLPLSSTGHSFSKAWMFTMNSRQHNSKKVPAWACIYRIKTQSKTNAKGTWFTPILEDYRGPGTAPVAAGSKLYVVDSVKAYDRGKALHDAFATGAKVAEAPDSGSVEKDEVPF